VPAAHVDHAVERVLRAFGVSAGSIAPIAAGNVNDSWRVDSAGRPWILRRYSTERLPAGIPFEHEVLRGLADGGWPVPTPVVAPDGSTLVKVDDRFYALFPYLPGERLDDPARHGAVLAGLHHATAVLRLTSRPTWPRLADYGRRPFGDLLAAYAAADPDGAAAVLLRHGHVARHLAHAPTTLPRLVVHGDFHTGNLLFRGGELTGVLDFDFARIDVRVADLAIALAFLGDRGQRDAFLAAYHAGFPLSPAEQALLPVLQQARELERITYALRRHRAGDATQIAEVRAGLRRLDRL
jgi:Ser/Thr protein kinase RdoA (MazF antagonist)